MKKDGSRLRRARLVLTGDCQREAFARPLLENKARAAEQTEICDRELGSSRRNKSKAANWFQLADQLLTIFSGFQRRSVTAWLPNRDAVGSDMEHCLRSLPAAGFDGLQCFPKA
jgi:hypothetical protein